jgi:hypothetical protein
MEDLIIVLGTGLITVMDGDTMILSSMIHGMHGVRAGVGAGEVPTGADITTAIGMATMMEDGAILMMADLTGIMVTEAAWLEERHILQEVPEA